jgi:hypothetical protein
MLCEVVPRSFFRAITAACIAYAKKKLGHRTAAVSPYVTYQQLDGGDG